MTNLTNILIALTFFVLGDWYFYKSEDLLFSVSVPCQLIKQSQELESDVGTLKVFNCYCAGMEEDPNLHYLINYVDYPENAFDKDSVEWTKDFLHSSIADNALNLEGKIDYESEIAHGDHEGILARISYQEDSMICKSKYIVAGNRFYAVQVHSPKGKHKNSNVQKFLDSFQILGE